ncbi:uncharacterized protein LOC141642940 [Silene latifolia]|uniref:uncharacterized protein LOC141642940 n=1 Tax=Silene latifolia TaxID=37657 RepID=UPI003D78A132
MAELIPSNSSTPPPPQFVSPPSVPRAMPAREDCWSEDATFTLIEAWGQRYLDLNRGNLRQKQWQEVADTVNARHGHIKKARRTDVQCKNRIDTLKKKYKIEKARVLDNSGTYKSPWPFFEPLDHLIGNVNAVVKKVSASPSQSPSLSPPLGVPIHHLGRNSASALGGGGMNMMSMSMRTPVLPQKRPAVTPVQQQEEYFRRNYAAVAAAAAREEESEEEEAAAAEEEEDEEEGEGADEETEEREGDGIRKLARVIEKFGEVYARVEKEKQRQLIELEKQRMQFAKELECQRMQMLVEMQVQLEKIKRAKRSNSDDMYS